MLLSLVHVVLSRVDELVWNQQVHPLLQVVVRASDAHEHNTRLNLLVVIVQATEQKYFTCRNGEAPNIAQWSRKLDVIHQLPGTHSAL